MKKLLLLAPALLVVPILSSAQGDSLGAKIDALRTPSYPGFTILGVQPTEISRPNSWRAMQTTLTNSFIENGKVVLPQNFAMEFNPFMATHQLNRGNSPSYLLSQQKEPSFCQSLKYNSAVSVATGQFNSYTDSTQQNPRMGIGYRTMLISMKPTDKAVHLFSRFKSIQRQYTILKTIIDNVEEKAGKDLNSMGVDALAATIREEATKVFNNLQTYPSDTTDIKALIDDGIKPLLSKNKRKNATALKTFEDVKKHVSELTDAPPYQESVDDVTAAMQSRTGHALEFAGAFLLDFPTNDISYSRLPKLGLWLTYTYRSENQHWEFAALGRYSTHKFYTDPRYNNFDAGGRIMLEDSKWNINGEFIQRLQFMVVDNKPATGPNEITFRYNADFKMSLNVNYKLTEDIIVNYTFGNNFSINTEFENQSDKSTLFSKLGIVYALGGPTFKNL